MEKFVIYKNNHSIEDVLWILLDITVIFLTIHSKKYEVFVPIIVVFTLPIINKAILWMRWLNSYAIKIENGVLILNHSILYRKIVIPIEKILEVNIDHQCLLLREPIRTSLFHSFVRKITFTNLSDSERKELLLYLDSCVMRVNPSL